MKSATTRHGTPGTSASLALEVLRRTSRLYAEPLSFVYFLGTTFHPLGWRGLVAPGGLRDPVAKIFAAKFYDKFVTRLQWIDEQVVSFCHYRTLTAIQANMDHSIKSSSASARPFPALARPRCCTASISSMTELSPPSLASSFGGASLRC